MKNISIKAFTLVELLVVITILAIISVVAYQNFGGAVDKAIGGRKINDILTIETSLQNYYADNNYYPSVDTLSANNMWGYTGSQVAQPSNTIDVTYNGEEIIAIDAATGGGAIYGTGGYASQQIGAKGTISRDTLGKKYLSKDLYDPELGDIKVLTNKMIDSGIGRYVYSVYKKPKGSNWGSSNKTGTNYNLAFTIKKDGSDAFITKIVGDYDEESCYDKKADCPTSLIGTLSGSTVNEVLVDLQEEGKDALGVNLGIFDSISTQQGIPYAVTDFAE